MFVTCVPWKGGFGTCCRCGKGVVLVLSGCCVCTVCFCSCYLYYCLAEESVALVQEPLPYAQLLLVLCPLRCTTWGFSVTSGGSNTCPLGAMCGDGTNLLSWRLNIVPCHAKCTWGFNELQGAPTLVVSLSCMEMWNYRTFCLPLLHDHLFLELS